MNSPGSASPRAVDAEVDTSERLCADDMATRREGEFLAAAMRAQARRAAGANPSTPGLCRNCGSQCHAAAVYCDAECREDDELREKQRARLAGRG
jgi:hypothetical protein